MTQSVELVLDAGSEAAVRLQWARLAEAGLPTEQRVEPSESHRPHVTLWAGPVVAAEVEAELGRSLGALDLTVRLGSALVFGPHRGRLVVVRQVVPSIELLDLQAGVAALCGVEVDSHFAPGRWSPHVTLARRVAVERVGDVVATLDAMPDLEARVRHCRRWDGDARRAWEVAAPT